MSRLVATIAVLVLLAPAAAAGPAEPALSAVDRALRVVWDDVVTDVWDDVAAVYDGLWVDEAPEEDVDASREAPSEPDDASDVPEEEETPPTYENDPLLGDAGPGAPLPLRPVRDAAERVPVAGGTLGAVFDKLGLGEANAAAPEAPASAPLAPAAAAVAPAPAFPPEASVAAAAVAAVAVAGAAGAATGFGPALLEKLRRLGAFLGLGLYTRLARQDLLDHGVRDRIYATVRDRPGVTLQELAETGGVGRTAAAYHLRVLAREGMVASRRDGRVRRFHANGAVLDAPARLAALGHPTGQALADEVRKEPGLDQSSLATRLGMSPSLAHWHLKRLESANVVQKVRDGRKVRYFPASA